MAKLNIKILESQNQINKGILTSILPDIKKDVDKGVSLVKSELPKIVNTIVTNSPVYNSILSGRLRYELGIPNSNSVLAELLQIWTTNIMYTYKPPFISGTQIISRFSASLFKANFDDVLGSQAAQVYDTVRGYKLPWLQWLLFYGNLPIIRDHEVVRSRSRSSRTGEAVMRRTGGSWSVPSEFSGTIDNNWITRAIESNSSQIDALLERAFN